MNKALIEILADPISRTRLSLAGEGATAETIIEGELRGPEGKSYPIRNGIPRFVLTDDSSQKQTQSSFGYKWQQRNSYDSPSWYDALTPWLLQRFGFDSVEDIRAYFGSRRRVPDALKHTRRHAEEEVRRRCEEAALSITRFDTQESGYTVRAIKG
ncbi:MAG TPA: hypothetical protein VF717_02330 [Pyrinomonadaceae bacterium]